VSTVIEFGLLAVWVAAIFVLSPGGHSRWGAILAVLAVVLAVQAVFRRWNLGRWSFPGPSE
jgi:hypothetical protein